MPEPTPHPLHPGVVRPVPRDLSGQSGPTRALARGPQWRQTSRGLYVPASADAENVDQRILEAAVRLPAYGGLTGWAALRWAGGTWFDGLGPDGVTRRPVALAVMHSEIRGQPGIQVTSERLPARDLTTYDGLALTHHARSVCFEMRYASSKRLAVVVLDMAARDDLVSIAEVKAYVFTLNGWTGVPQCRWALAHADENSWSPMESLMRLIWILDAGFPRPLCNIPVFDRDGNHIGTPDVIDVEAGVVGEYDGPLHLEGKRRARDLDREAAFRRVGLEYFTMIAADQACPESTIVPRMIGARSRARFAAESTRAWTIEPPPWWTSTTTVAARRALSERQRARLLRYRTG